MTINKILFAGMFLLAILSFTAFKPKEQLQFKTGTYGACSFDNQNATKIELTINSDSTFRYYDNSNRANVADVKGKWTRKGNTILLKDFSSDRTVPDQWQIDKNEKCLKSRRGLEFIRICNLENCGL